MPENFQRDRGYYGWLEETQGWIAAGLQSEGEVDFQKVAGPISKNDAGVF